MEITHHKFSLCRTERPYGLGASNLLMTCFEFIATYNTLEEAKSAQKEIEYQTLILPSY